MNSNLSTEGGGFWSRLKAMRLDPKRAMLGDVCKALSSLIGVPVLIVRLCFVAAVAYFGVGVGIYFLLMIFIPNEENELPVRFRPAGDGSA